LRNILSRIDLRGSAFAPAQFLQQHVDLDARLGIALTKLQEHAASPYLIGLLRASRTARQLQSRQQLL
jgi:hypothetical protein